MRKKYYIGLAATFHDQALAIVDNEGRVVFAEGTERELQHKRAMNCPPDLINSVKGLLLRHCGADADFVVANTWTNDIPLQAQEDVPLFLKLLSMVESGQQELSSQLTDRERAFLQKRGFDTQRVGDFGTRALFALHKMAVSQHANAQASVGKNIEYRIRELTRDYAKPIVPREYDHHLTHAAASCYASGYSDAVCAVVDGLGQGTSTSFYTFRDGGLTTLVKPENDEWASLGQFYWHLCTACGFDALKGEEWKVMGLAPYGSFDEGLYRLIRPMFRVDDVHLHCAPDMSSRLGEILQMQYRWKKSRDAANLAYVGQLVFGEVMTELLTNLYTHRTSDNLVLTGGCALNSAYNGQISERTPWKNVFVYAAPGDDGNALGAALLAYADDAGRLPSSPSAGSPYLGTDVSDDMLRSVLRFSGLTPEPRTLSDEDLINVVAGMLADGKIIGWMQGRAEFGPRALGNRSILADPRRAEMKDIVNERVKFREEFRPFAPSILGEHGPEYFENYQDSPYMERALRFRPEVRDKVPAVVHVDGTGRLQSVSRKRNPRFYDLIERFYRLTGVPVLLNTSFNVMGKPIVHSVDDALVVFFTSGLDVLVIGNCVFEKPRFSK